MISSLIRQHERYRFSGINLIASENRMTSAARMAMSSDLVSRYCEEWYGGYRYAADLVAEVEQLARVVLKTQHAFVTPLSGNICDLAALFSFTEHGDAIAAVPKEQGGYPLGYHKFGRHMLPLPMEDYDIQVENAHELIASEEPAMTMLGASTILFPHPVASLCGAGHDTLLYDASHILGLIAGGTFQQPLQEGADVMIGSTHKSFPGPQGGIALTNSDEHAEALTDTLEFDFEGGIGLVDNPHLHRIAALGITLEEMRDHGATYARQVVANARALAGALHDQGMPVRCADLGYTESHQVLLSLPPNEARHLCRTLEDQHIFIDISGRIGVAEATHIGMQEDEMEAIARLINAAAQDEQVRDDVAALASQFYSDEAQAI
jgi:glycine hydroxymethyltransferase